MTGAELITAALQEQKVSTIFGLPGAQNIELFDALHEAGITLILPTNELNGAFMADGFGRASGKVGVLVTVPGPGLTNSLTGVAEALMDSNPMVVFFCDIDSTLPEAFQLHEIDQEETLYPFVKELFWLEPDTIQEAKGTILEAFQAATSGEPGPVGVLIPFDFFNLTTETSFDYAGETRYEEASQKEIQQAVALIKHAKKPAIYVGMGAIRARDELLMLAEALNAPVATTISGKGLIPEDHPLAVGYGFGPSGTKIAERIFKKVDCLIDIGCKFGEVATGHYGMKVPKNLIHIDINPDHLDRHIKPTLSIVSDARVALIDILGELGSYKRPEDRVLKDQIAAYWQTEEKNLESLKPHTDDVNPKNLVYSLRKHSTPDAIVTFDAGLASVEEIKTAVTAADFLNDKVLPFFDSKGVRLLRTLTDRGTEYCGIRESHPYQLYLYLNDIEHSRTKARHPQTNGCTERLNQTIMDEFYKVAFRKKLYTSLEEIQSDLDSFMETYNTKRTNQGKRCQGRTPMETFTAGLELCNKYVQENREEVTKEAA